MKKSSIPNIFTFINLSCGILSILNTYNSNYIESSLFILIAGLVDRYDGRIARFLDVSSEVGKELDSLADLVSFGVAPSLLSFIVFDLVNIGPLGIIGYICLLSLPICGAYRLARYNISTFDGVFTGVPITIVGCFMALYILIGLYITILPLITILLSLILSYLMISTFKLKKL